MIEDELIAGAPDVCSRILDGDAVLLDLATGTYFGLDEVGARFWELLGEGGMRLGDIKNKLLDEYEVDEETLVKDLDELVATLETKGLIVRTPG
jgi:hypothetical protein